MDESVSVVLLISTLWMGMTWIFISWDMFAVTIEECRMKIGFGHREGDCSNCGICKTVDYFASRT